MNKFTLHFRVAPYRFGPSHAERIDAPTLSEIVTKFRAFIEAGAYGSSQISRSRLVCDDKTIGYVSYNGRVWDNENKEITL